MISINKIRIAANCYSDASFTEKDCEDENYIMFMALTEFTIKAYHQLKTVETE